MYLNMLDICRLLDSVCVGMAAETALCKPSGAAIDSRAVTEGDLFFCLPGEKADGHDFAAAAVKKGALAVIGTRNPFAGTDAPVPVILVEDAVKALGAVAAAHRKTTNAVVVGVTGTSGKTSVKETLFAVLSEHGDTAKNPMNLNNQIGLPLSMCNAPEDAAYWVMEAGISQPHDMDELGSILQPDVALILNAGAGHVQELGDKGVAYYKARLAAHLAHHAYGPEGFTVASADYPDLVREVSAHGKKTLWFSAEDASSPYFAEYLGPVVEGSASESTGPHGSESCSMGNFSLHLNGAGITVTAPFQGGYGAENVAAVGAVAHALGLAEKEITAGFAKAKLPNQRFAITHAGPYLVIDDSYNANPLSMRRMLDAAAERARSEGADLVLVLGEMGELGPESPAFHRELGKYAASLSPKAVYWKGGQVEEVAGGLREAGYTGAFAPVLDAADFAATFAVSDVKWAVVLFKGSRSNKLEELVTAFTHAAGGTGVDKGKEDAV
ncbi:MAG: UDP-N-acetylmuramoyl-tripeptide--D-alanyl-D-alanine ligase [Desulfovibrio sp.]